MERNQLCFAHCGGSGFVDVVLWDVVQVGKH